MIFLLQPFTLGNLSPRIFPGPRRGLQAFGPAERILIHEALTDLDCRNLINRHSQAISIHEALTDLEASAWIIGITLSNFNPRGPHGPRLFLLCHFGCGLAISIHEVLTDLDKALLQGRRVGEYFNPRGPHGPRLFLLCHFGCGLAISIHEALTDLDHSGISFR